MESQSSSAPRNLVVCIDGTSNQFGPKNTNVIELYSQIIKSPRQLTYYNSGIGTYAKPSWKSWSYLRQALTNKVDLAIAWNFENTVKAAYRWLSENYQENDRIYLFGFSRGAYQVRALAGMIHKVGLIHKGNEDQIPFAYELYLDQKSGEYAPEEPRTFLQYLHYRPQPTKQEPIDLADRFKTTFSRENVNVHFVGVWDTVSSIGIIRGKSLPLTDTVDHVRFFRHALALDERRVKFLPEYGSKFPTDSQMVQPNEEWNSSLPPKVKEVWFPGTHSDIGGGNRINVGLNLGKTPALWMSFEAISCGLSLKPSKIDWDWENLDDVKESLTSVWNIFEWLPFKRLTYKDATSVTYRLHRGRGRKMWAGQKIHASVAFCPPSYRPRAVLPPGSPLDDWEEVIHKGIDERMEWAAKCHDMLEMDMFDISAVGHIVGRLSSTPENDYELWLHRLAVMTRFSEGRSALLKAEAINMLGILLRDRPVNIQIRALHALIALFQDQLSTTLEDQVLRILIRTISRRNEARVRGLAVRCLSYIDLDEPKWRNIFQNRILDSISQLLMDEGHHVVLEMLETLDTLLKYGEFREMLLTGDTIAAAQRSFINYRSTEALQILATHEELRARLFNNAVMDAFVEMLGSDGQLNRAFGLVSIAVNHEDLRTRLFDGAMMVVIRDMLGSDDGDSEWVSRNAMMLLLMAADHEELRTKLFDDATIAAIIPAIERQLNRGDNRRVKSTLGWLSKAANHEELRTRLFDDAMMAVIRDTLGSDNGDNEWRDRNAMVLLSITVDHEELRTKLFDDATIAAIIPTVVGQLNSGGDEKIESALRFLSKAVVHEELRAKLFNDATIAAIMPVILKLLKSHLGSATETAMDFLSEANYEEIRTRLFDDAIIVVIRDRLAGDNESASRIALRLLSMAADNEGLRTRLFDDAMAAVIRDMLVGWHDSKRKHALNFLSMVADHEELRTKLFEDATIAAIVSAIRKLLRYYPDSPLGAAVGLLSKAANYEELRTRLLDNAMMTFIRNILGSDEKSARDGAINFLSVAVDHEELRMRIFDDATIAAIIPAIEKQLSSGDRKKIESAVDFSLIAAGHEEIRTKLFGDAVVAAIISAILKQLSSGDDEKIGSAVGLLSKAVNQEELRARLFDGAMMIVIRDMLGSNKKGARDGAMNSLSMAADHEELRTKLFDDATMAAIIPAIMKQLSSGDNEKMESALRLLSKVVVNEELRTGLFDDDMVVALRDMLGHHYEPVRAGAMKLLSMAVDHEELRTRIFDDATTIPVILKQLSSGNSKKIESAVGLLLLSINREDLRAGLLDDALMVVIRDMLGDYKESARAGAMKFLSKAVDHANLRTRLFDDSMIVIIKDMLSNDNKWARDTASRLLSIATKYEELRPKLLVNSVLLAVHNIRSQNVQPLAARAHDFLTNAANPENSGLPAITLPPTSVITTSFDESQGIDVFDADQSENSLIPAPGRGRMY